MYSIHQHRKAAAMAALAGAGVLAAFVACLLGSAVMLERVGPWAALATALIASAVWWRWGLAHTSGPLQLMSRILVFGLNGLIAVAALARLIG